MRKVVWCVLSPPLAALTRLMRTVWRVAALAVTATSHAVRAAFGIDEILLVAGLVLITVAAWPAIGQYALACPGLVLVWIALPSRSPFISRPPAEPPDRRDR